MARRAWSWTGLTLVALVVAFLASFVVASTPSRFGWEAPVRLDLASWLVLFGALGGGGWLVAARIAFGAWPDVRLADGLLAALGFGIAAAEEVVLHEWAEASIGYYESDFIGPTGLLSFALVLLAIALFGTRVAPVGASLPPRLSVVIGAMTVLMIALSNLPTLADGIGGGVLVAATTGLSGIYAVAALLLVLVPRH